MKEIPETLPENYGYEPSGATCPNCGQLMMYGPVRCPDARPGCLVAHCGYTCFGCGKQWTS